MNYKLSSPQVIIDLSKKDFDEFILCLKNIAINDDFYELINIKNDSSCFEFDIHTIKKLHSDFVSLDLIFKDKFPGNKEMDLYDEFTYLFEVDCEEDFFVQVEILKENSIKTKISEMEKEIHQKIDKEKAMLKELCNYSCGRSKQDNLRKNDFHNHQYEISAEKYIKQLDRLEKIKLYECSVDYGKMTFEDILKIHFWDD